MKYIAISLFLISTMANAKEIICVDNVPTNGLYKRIELKRSGREFTLTYKTTQAHEPLVSETILADGLACTFYDDPLAGYCIAIDDVERGETNTVVFLKSISAAFIKSLSIFETPTTEEYLEFDVATPGSSSKLRFLASECSVRE